MSWKEVEHGGTTYNIYQQHDINNCGPSSIAILLKQALNKDVSLGFIQMACGKVESKDGFNSGRTGDSRWHDWGDGGWTIGWTLLHTLQQKWSDLNANEDHGCTSADLTDHASPDKPAICRVGWDGGNGGHFFVCVGANGGNLVFLDPYFGLVALANTNNTNELQYSTLGGSFSKGASTGSITYAVYTSP